MEQSEVQEFLDGVQFSSIKSRDLKIAEAIASNSYASLDDLAAECKRYMEPKFIGDFETYLAEYGA